MPLYTYKREDGELIEIQQGFEDEPLTHDPDTGMPMKRVLTSVKVAFKGKGFYVTDNQSSTSQPSNSQQNSDGKSDDL